MIKNPPAMQEMQETISGTGRSSGGGNGNLFQHSWLGIPIDKEVLWAIVHGGHKRVRHNLVSMTTTKQIAGSSIF